MIVETKKSDVIVCGDVKSSAFKIQASAKAFEILSSNIYTNKVRAIIREVSCNAHDAHVAVGNKSPFDVHLPTYLEPWLSIRDYGPGLSDDQIREVYTTYFFSTKTESNDYIGALGLGSKSPFCLVDSFSVTSYHNGTKRIYTCFKSENGEPAIAMLAEETTGESNGLLVHVDVEGRYYPEFTEEAVEIYKYFSNVPNINIPEVKQRVEEYKNSLIVNTGDIKTNMKRGETVVVMGNVAYNLPSQYQNYIEGEIVFNIGELSFDPGRENLSLDTKTINNLKAKLENFENVIAEYICNDIESQPDLYNKARKAQMYSNNARFSSTVSAKISKACENYKCEVTTQYLVKTLSYRGSVNTYTEKGPLKLNNVVFFHNKPGYTQRLDHCLRQQNLQHNHFILLTPEQIAESQIDPSIVLCPSILEKPIRANKQTVKKGKVFLWNWSYSAKTAWVEKTNIPQEVKVYVKIHNNKIWGSKKFPDLYYLKKRLTTLRELNIVNSDDLPTDIYGVKSSYCDSKQFKSDNNWIHIDDYISNLLKSFHGKDFLSESDTNYELLLKIAKNVDMEDFKQLEELHKEYSTQSELMSFLQQLWIPINKVNSLSELVNTIYSKYPMLKYVDIYNFNSAKQHVLEYIDLMA